MTRADKAITIAVKALLEADLTDRHTLGSVAAYLLRWSLIDLTSVECDAAMNEMSDFVLGRFDG